MRKGFSVKKNDTILVIAGKDKGRKGRVLRVIPGREKLVVERLNIKKKHLRPSRRYRHGGILEIEAPMHISNVMVVCSKCQKAVRVKRKILENGKRVRICGKCGEMLDKA